MKASVIDYVRDDLDPTIWDVAEGEPKLRNAVKMQIIDTVMSALDDFDIPESVVKGLFVYGSLLTNQYNESTDLDCRVLLYKEPMDKLYPGLTGEDIFDYLRDYLHGIPLEDSKHPLNVSVMIEGEDQELGRTEFDPVYDVLVDKFIQLPVFSPSDFDPQQEFGEARDQAAMVMEYLDKTLREAKTKTIDYEVLEEAMSEVEHPEELRSRLEAKLQEIKTDLQELVEDYEQIKDERSKALTTEIEGNPHKEPGNVLYKYLERYQYLDMLKKIKHIMKHGLEHEEIPELEEALKIASKSDVYIKKLDIEGAPADLEIWLVDGGLVRKDYFIDFTLGGHDLVYDFIPHKQIWIDDDTAKDELEYVVKHELDERAEMEEGKSYDEAHDEASEVEQEARKGT